MERVTRLMCRSVAMAKSPPISDLVKASKVITFLDFSAVVAAHMANLPAPANQHYKLSKADDQYKEYITEALDEPHEVPTNGISEGLYHIKTRCLDLAKAMAQPISQTITALATEEIAMSDPQRGWELVSPQVADSTFCEDVARLTEDMKTWLALAWK